MEAQQVLLPQVTLNDAINYSKVWTHNGIAIALTQSDCQFATDFANIVLKNFVLQCAAQVEAQVQRQATVTGEISASVEGKAVTLD